MYIGSLYLLNKQLFFEKIRPTKINNYNYGISINLLPLYSIQYDVVWYSDDGGKTYNVSETALKMMDEAQLVETADGHILANMRNNHLNMSCDCRAVSVSTDGGKSFGSITYDSTLISPVSKSSCIKMTGSFQGRTQD